MKHTFLMTFIGLALGGVVGASFAATPMSTIDRTFIAKVSQGGMFEVQAGQVAADKGNTQDIRDQGDTEAHDHKLVGDKLKTIADQGGITFPSTLNSSFQAKIDALKTLSGAAFDAAYLKDMSEIHSIDGAAFAKEAKEGSDSDLKAFAAETHRIVLRHIGELHALGPAP